MLLTSLLSAPLARRRILKPLDNGAWGSREANEESSGRIRASTGSQPVCENRVSLPGVARQLAFAMG
jgi:hypothetical protein